VFCARCVDARLLFDPRTSRPTPRGDVGAVEGRVCRACYERAFDERAGARGAGGWEDATGVDEEESDDDDDDEFHDATPVAADDDDDDEVLKERRSPRERGRMGTSHDDVERREDERNQNRDDDDDDDDDDDGDAREHGIDSVYKSPPVKVPSSSAKTPGSVDATPPASSFEAARARIEAFSKNPDGGPGPGPADAAKAKARASSDADAEQVARETSELLCDTPRAMKRASPGTMRALISRYARLLREQARLTEDAREVAKTVRARPQNLLPRHQICRIHVTKSLLHVIASDHALTNRSPPRRRLDFDSAAARRRRSKKSSRSRARRCGAWARCGKSSRTRGTSSSGGGSRTRTRRRKDRTEPASEEQTGSRRRSSPAAAAARIFSRRWSTASGRRLRCVLYTGSHTTALAW
jgi:hypothetical protein